MAHANSPGAGLRRFDTFAAQAEQVASEFRGLPENCGPAQALAAFKRAAPYMQIPPGIVQLIDLMFAWTRSEDWMSGSLPIVWPRNDKIARKLGLGVRQVQNLLDRALRLRLISHRDSPNGHRGGQRADDGSIKWAYGIVLAPVGARLEEFTAIAARGAAEDVRIEALRKRLGAARRRTAALAQTALDHMLPSTGADEELELARSATRQMRQVRDVDLLTGCVEQIEHRGRALEAIVTQALAAMNLGAIPSDEINNTCSDDLNYTHSTTTTQPQTAKADTSSGLAKRRSQQGSAKPEIGTTAVEEDLEKHGVDPAFIESVAPEICYALKQGIDGWGDVIHLAERLAEQNGIHRSAWHEALRLMGVRGAAASVIATVHKYQMGEVHRPGAYLRGMSDKASRGDLNLGRTFHGFKDNRQAVMMRAMHSGSDPRSVGDIARRALSGLVLSGRS